MLRNLENMTTAGRLLQLLALLQTPRDWTGTELAARLEVSTRTIRKDVERLRDLGYPVAGLPGATGGYRLRPGAQLPPLLLDDDEVVAVTLGLHAAAAGSLSGIEETSLRALTKITALLPSRLRRRTDALQQASVLLPGGGPRVDAGLLQQVAQACRDHEGLRFDYVSGAGATSRRRAEPYQLVHRRGRWYLLAFDLDRDDWRTYRLDRITLRTPGGARFRPRPVPGGDAAAYVDAAVGGGGVVVATLRLHAPWDAVRPWFQTAWGELAPIDEHFCLARLRNDSFGSIAVGMGLSGLEFDVLGPPELRTEVAELAGRLGRATTADPASIRTRG